jgi:AcrR family transcriptional regulator
MAAKIKETARLLLTTGGTDAVSVRAIAREIGITPAAIYRYYSSIQELVDELRADIMGELGARVKFVHDETCTRSPATRIGEMAQAFRKWAIEHPSEFWLVLGPSSSGPPACQVPQFAAYFFGDFLQSWKYFHSAANPVDQVGEPACTDAHAAVAEGLPGLPRAAVSGFLSAWIRLFGVVAMEISGQVKWLPVDAADLEALVQEQLAELGCQVTAMTTTAGIGKDDGACPP